MARNPVQVVQLRCMVAGLVSACAGLAGYRLHWVSGLGALIGALVLYLVWNSVILGGDGDESYGERPRRARKHNRRTLGGWRYR